MTFKDIEYQNTAVDKIIDLLDDAWSDHATSLHKVAEGKRANPRRFAVYLSALTGAGKTIMVGRVLEHLLRDPETLVLWLSDSPSLNEQTKDKLEGLIEPNRLRVIDKVGVNDRMEPGHIYFLNPQKLGRQREGGKGERDMLARWRFLSDAIADPTVRLYVVQDEAHRGVTRRVTEAGDKVMTSIVEATSEHLVGRDPVPVILGVTATPKGFIDAVKLADREPKGYTVPAEKIQESGLIKRDLDFRTPQEKGTSNRGNREAQLGMLDQAVAALKANDDGWAAFHAQESAKGGYSEKRVVPLVLFQVQDGITDDEIGEWVRHLNDAWDRHFGHGLPPGSVAHVLQEHKTVQAGDYELPYCAPQYVQETTSIRVLIAKLAVTTGWDCPRAEVLYSLRGHSDETFIAQLIGRMVRMPLAERSLSAELDLLNVARVLLPYFHAETLARVVEGVKTGEIPSRSQVDMVRVEENPDILQEYGQAPFDLISNLTKAAAPSSTANPIALMNQLSVMVATDEIPGVGPDPGKRARSMLYGLLDEFAESHGEDMADTRTRLGRREETQTVARNWVVGGQLSRSSNDVELDPAGRAAKIDRLVTSLPGGMGPGYVKHLRAAGATPVEAREKAACLALFERPVTDVAEAARDQSRRWLEMVRDVLDEDEQQPAAQQRFLESRRIEYRKRMAQFGDPIPTRVGTLGPREVSFGPHDARFEHGWLKHLLVEPNGDGKYLLDVTPTSWEKRVLNIETARVEVVAWYRNPSAGSEGTLQVPWKDDNDVWRSAHPDFVFVEETDDELKASVVDPHDPDRDGLARLRGAARFVEQYGHQYARFWSVGNPSSGSSDLFRLNLKDNTVRTALFADGADAHNVYAHYGVPYL